MNRNENEKRNTDRMTKYNVLFEHKCAYRIAENAKNHE